MSGIVNKQTHDNNKNKNNNRTQLAAKSINETSTTQTVSPQHNTAELHGCDKAQHHSGKAGGNRWLGSFCMFGSSGMKYVCCIAVVVISFHKAVHFLDILHSDA